MISNWKEYLFTVTSDLYRYCGQRNFRSFVNCYFFIPGFRYSFFMRSAQYFKTKGLFFLPFYTIARILLNHYQFKFGISIPYNTNIGSGLYIGHFGGIVVNCKTIIGCNCNLNHGVTIGAAFGGKYEGTPVVMDNVYFGPGSKIIGGILLGNHVAVGANCVVTRPIADYSVVVGIPARVVSMKGSSQYIINTIDIA